MAFIIAIDGPAGSGKSSVSREVAKKLHFTYIDTGAIYRALAFLAAKNDLSFDNEEGLALLAQKMKISFETSSVGQRVILNGVDVSQEIRSVAMSQGSSKVSRHKAVRDALLALQQNLGEKSAVGAVMEGRDIGTVVFPDADMKFFVTASNEVRASRRYHELLAQGVDADREHILAEIIERDKRDESRAVAPLKRADDAMIVDTSHMNQAAVIDYICKIVEEKIG